MGGTIPPPDGSVAADLAELAAREGVDLGTVEARPGDRAQIEACLTSGRGEIIITRRSDGDVYQVLFVGVEMTWAQGLTLDLTEVARAAEAWRAGATLRELSWRYPFMAYTELAQAYEDGTEVEYKWRTLLNDPSHGPYGPLLRALRADRVLGALPPSTSHHNYIRLDLGPTRSYAQVHVIQLRDHIQVEGSWDMRPQRADTIAEAVALAAALVASHPQANAPE